MAAKNDTFFSVHTSCAHLVPVSLTNAMRLASHILRSEHHKDIFVSVYDKLPGVGPHHINRDALTELVNKHGVVSINKIRLTGYLNARSVMRRDNDLWTICLNPLLLLEAQDREREANELNNATDKHSFADFTNTCPFNQLAYVQQKKRAIPDTPMSPPTSTKSRARLWSLTGAIEAAAAKAPVLVLMDDLTVIPSGMSVLEKDTLFFTILLLHNAHHFINQALSCYSTGLVPSTPAKMFSHAEGIDSLFDDIGHLMERHLWGFCIGHAGEAHAPTPFGVSEIIGTLWQNKGKKSVLVASPALRALLTNPTADPLSPITAELLRLIPTSGGTFAQKATTVVLGGLSAGDVAFDSEGEETERVEGEEGAVWEEPSPAENMKLPGSSLFIARS